MLADLSTFRSYFQNVRVFCSRTKTVCLINLVVTGVCACVPLRQEVSSVWKVARIVRSAQVQRTETALLRE